MIFYYLEYLLYCDIKMMNTFEFVHDSIFIISVQKIRYKGKTETRI
jgi:hypothetical protein